jgi:hypothetical protein
MSGHARVKNMPDARTEWVAQFVKLRLYTGRSIELAGELLGFSRATAYRHWNYARAWLRCEIEGDTG